MLTQQLTSISKPYRENIAKLVTFFNPNRKDMKVIVDDYLNGVSDNEISDITNKLRENKHSRLEIMLRHPYTYKVVVP